jgi:hypothetical protein
MPVGDADPFGIVPNHSTTVLTTLQTAYTVARTRSGACTSPPTVLSAQAAATRRSYRSTPNSPIRKLSPLTLDPLIERNDLTTPSDSPVRSDTVLPPFTPSICSVQVIDLATIAPTNNNVPESSAASLPTTGGPTTLSSVPGSSTTPLHVAPSRRPFPSFKRLPKRREDSPASSDSSDHIPLRPIMPNAAAELIVSSTSKPPVLTAVNCRRSCSASSRTLAARISAQRRALTPQNTSCASQAASRTP